MTRSSNNLFLSDPDLSDLWCAGQTGAVSRMKESDDEGVATHVVPESWGGGREAVGQALTGVHAGWDMELRKRRPAARAAVSRVPTPSEDAEGNTLVAVRRGDEGPDAVEDPTHAWTHRAREPGDPTTRLLRADRVRRGQR